MLFQRLNPRTRTILILQAIGMLMGASTHILWIAQNGWLSTEYNAPLFTMIFWDSLAILDVLASALLIFRPRIGLWVTATIILVDVVHNNTFYFDELYRNAPPLGEWLIRYWMIAGQILFGVFVFATLRWNLKEVKQTQIEE